MSIILTPDFVRTVIGTKHKNHAICVDLAHKIDVHAKGLIPEKLITERRPSESEEIKAYRKLIYKPITKRPISKVINSLSKIRRSQDWNVQYNTKDIPKTVASSETLQEYCEYNYPQFTSLTNWAFNELLIRSLIDANSVCAVILKKLPENKSEYFKPEVEIFSSHQILNYSIGEYYCLKSSEIVIQKIGEQIITEGSVYYVITDTQIARYEEKNGNYVQTLIYDHNFGEVPVFKVGGIYYERKNNDIIQESRIADMVPFLDEAAREYSDLQAEIVQHIFSEKYMITSSECPECKGLGFKKNDDGKEHECLRCKGSGNISNKSPFGEWIINMGRKTEENPIPMPPVGFVQKSTEIARLQDDRVDRHIYKALSVVNMEFLAESPLSQSGIAKEVDRDELNNFVNSVAEDIVMVLDKVYYYICQYRYSIIVPDKEKRNSMLPVIPVPEKFDILNSSILVTEIQSAKTANVNSLLIKNMEVELARKKFNADSSIAYQVECTFEFDPLYSFTQDEKMTMLSNGGITERDYVISCNISQFIQRAFIENVDFEKKSYSDKKKIIQAYADEIITENSAKAALSSKIQPLLNEPAN